MKQEFARQGMHLVFTVSLACTSLLLSQQWFLVLVAGLLAGLVAFVYFRPESTFFLHVLEREHDKKRFPGKGAIMLLVGAFITATLFPAHILPALLVLGISDSLSTILGMEFGKKRIFRAKTWLGTTTFFVCSCAILIFFSSWWFLIALVVTGAELVNYHSFLFLDDNLIIPLVVATLLTIV